MKYVLQVRREDGRISNLFSANIVVGKLDNSGRLECFEIDGRSLPPECKNLTQSDHEKKHEVPIDNIRITILKNCFRWNKRSKTFEKIAVRGKWKRV